MSLARFLLVLAVAVAAVGAGTPLTRHAHAAPPAPTITPPKPLALVDAALPPGTPAIAGEVELVLTIDTAGAVTDVALTRGLGAPYDDAAIQAAKRFRFVPAMSGDQPIAVKVPFKYAYRRPARRGRAIAERAPRRDLEPAPGYVFAGEVVEKGTRTPQPGIPVVIRDARTNQRWDTLTDARGRFVIFGLPKGKLTLDIFTGAYEPLTRPVRVAAASEPLAREGAERYFLAPSGLSAYRTIVREKKTPRAASEIELTEDELTNVAGTLGDPTRVVATLPGVARSPFGLGYYVVRGAEFDNTGFFIDGHPAIFLYHLLGGPGVVYPELVGDIAFYPGGYPAEFGHVASSVISLHTKDPPRDRWHLDLDVDLFKAGFLFSVPFDRDDRGHANGIATISLRRSYYELILPAITKDITLDYTDYQARVSYDFSPSVRGRFVAMGAVDALETLDVATQDGAGHSTTTFGLGFHRLNAALDVDLDKTLTLSESVFWEYDYLENKRVASGDANIDATTDGFMLQLLSALHWRPTKTAKFQLGLELGYADYRAQLAIPAAPPLGDPRPPVFAPIIVTAGLKSPYFTIDPYLSADLELAPGLRLLPGLRLNLDRYADRIVPNVDPKLAIRWTVHPDWTLKAMGAMAHQPPQIFQVAAPFGDPSIPPVLGIQGSLGLEWKPADGWFISLEGFYQYLDQLVRPSGQLASNDGDVGRVYWSSDLEGRAFGAELLVRKEFGDWIYGWLSYTFSRAERLRPPRDWGLFELDQTHILNLAWTVRLGAEWSLGLRFQLASGNPYYPIVGARFDADQDQHAPVYAARSSRLPVYHRLDLRLDKTWRFEDWMFQLYLDIQNVYNQTNPETPRYSYDYRIKVDGISLPILPSIGFRMVF